MKLTPLDKLPSLIGMTVSRAASVASRYGYDALLVIKEADGTERIAKGANIRRLQVQIDAQGLVTHLVRRG